MDDLGVHQETSMSSYVFMKTFLKHGTHAVAAVVPCPQPSPAQVSASRNFLFQEYLQSKGTLTSSRPQTCLGCR